MKTELFRCGGDCGLLYPLLVDRRGPHATCVACGHQAHRMSEPEVIDELRSRMRLLVGPEAGPGRVAGDLDASPVNLRQRLHAAEQVGEILRVLETASAGRAPEPAALRETPW